jgi:hypothetical protein
LWRCSGETIMAQVRRSLFFLLILLLAGCTHAPTPSTPAAAVTAAAIRGVNWADGRDNFVCGDVIPTGLWSTDTRAQVASKSATILRDLVDVSGANTVRLPVNVDTVAGPWWNAYTVAIDTATSQGLNVILSEWDQCDSLDGRLDPGWPAMWDKVVAKYGANRQVLFEIMNEPYGYSTADWLNTAAGWLARYLSLPRGRIIVSGPGYNDNATSVGRDARFNGTLLSVHHYAFWQSSLTYDQWKAQTATRVGKFAARTVFTEYGTFMTTGLNFDTAKSAKNEVRYLRGVTDEFSALGVGAVYWPGLRSGDKYSLTSISGDAPGGSGASITMDLNNRSGLDRIRHGWDRP